LQLLFHGDPLSTEMRFCLVIFWLPAAAGPRVAWAARARLWSPTDGAQRGGAGNETPKRTFNRRLGAPAAKQLQLSNAGDDPRKSWPPWPARRVGEVARGSAQSSRVARSRGARPTARSSGLTGRSSAAQVMPHRPPLRGFDQTHGRRGRVAVYVTPGCFAHPKTRAFWLGGVSEDRRAQGQQGMV
jgi:hypothetical protein